MTLVKYSTVIDFLSENEKLLLEHESFHNLILGLAYGIRDQKIETLEPLYYSLKNTENTIIASMLRSHSDRPLVITEMSHIKIDLLISELLLSKIEIKAVVGEEKAATYFNKEWTRLNGKNSKINLHLGVYECRDLISPSNKQNSQFITAKIEHSDIIRKYLNGFLLDCFPLNKPSEIEIEKLMNRHIDGQSLFLLLNETREVVSMAANTRSTLNGGTISLVYTPPEQRGRGYASLTVASLSQKILESGKKFVNLYTDLTNPTSNSIYQKIGFVKIGQNIHFDFVEKI